MVALPLLIFVALLLVAKIGSDLAFKSTLYIALAFYWSVAAAVVVYGGYRAEWAGTLIWHMAHLSAPGEQMAFLANVNVDTANGPYCEMDVDATNWVGAVETAILSLDRKSVYLVVKLGPSLIASSVPTYSDVTDTLRNDPKVLDEARLLAPDDRIIVSARLRPNQRFCAGGESDDDESLEFVADFTGLQRVGSAEGWRTALVFGLIWAGLAMPAWVLVGVKRLVRT